MKDEIKKKKHICETRLCRIYDSCEKNQTWPKDVGPSPFDLGTPKVEGYDTANANTNYKLLVIGVKKNPRKFYLWRRNCWHDCLLGDTYSGNKRR